MIDGTLLTLTADQIHVVGMRESLCFLKSKCEFSYVLPSDIFQSPRYFQNINVHAANRSHCLIAVKNDCRAVGSSSLARARSSSYGTLGTLINSPQWMTPGAPVTLPGDLNGDFNVRLADLVTLANAYGRTSNDTPGIGPQKWNMIADVDYNGIVGLSDLVILASYYGQHSS